MIHFTTRTTMVNRLFSLIAAPFECDGAANFFAEIKPFNMLPYFRLEAADFYGKLWNL